MKRVLVLTTAYQPAVGGAEVAVQEIVGRLTAHFSFVILTHRFQRSWPRHEVREGVEIWRLGFGTRLDRIFLFPFLVLCKAWQLHRRNPFNLLWAIMVSYASIGGYFFKKLNSSLPMLLTLQEGDSEQHLRYGKFGLIDYWWKRLVLQADRIQAISKHLKSRAVSFGKADHLVWVIQNGVDVSRFHPDYPKGEIEAVREKLGFKSGDKIIITVSRLVEKNAVDICIRALQFLDDYSYKLLVVGDGPLRAELGALARRLHVSSRVVWTGSVSHDELPRLLCIANIFARPSRSEGLGNAFLEAMATATPIIGTAVGGISDFLEHNKTGLICKVDDPRDLAQQIKLLILDSEAAVRLGRNGMEWVRANYTWESIVSLMGNLFDKMLNNK